MNNLQLPLLTTTLDANSNSIFTKYVERVLLQLLPLDFFQEEELLERFSATLPMVSWSALQEPPFCLSFFFCVERRSDSSRFFNEMVARRALPGKKVSLLANYAVDFFFPDSTKKLFTAGEVMIKIESREDLELLCDNLNALDHELRKGMLSSYQAERILAAHSWTSQEKAVRIQENIALLVEKRPQDFDYDIFSEMQRFLVLTKGEFQEKREVRILSKIVALSYLFRKALHYSKDAFPERRYISSKLFPVERGWGVLFSMSFLKQSEILEERHLVQVVKNLLPEAELVAGSFFFDGGLIPIWYFEIEKASVWQSEDIRKLKMEFPEAAKEAIEKRLSPIFMPENAEEILRQMLTLAGELKYPHDLPQLIINFRQQSGDSLEFLVVLARLVKEDSLLIEKIFEARQSVFEFQLRRSNNMGDVGKKCKKETTVFTINILKSPFLRQDHSVDLNKARQAVGAELKRLLGDFRDYNGGTLTKEGELLHKLQGLLGRSGEENSFLLENFFYSITPSIMRSVLPPDPLKKLFDIFVELEETSIENKSLIKISEESPYYCIAIKSRNPQVKDLIKNNLSKLKIPSLPMASASISKAGYILFGLIAKNEPSLTLSLRIIVEKSINS